MTELERIRDALENRKRELSARIYAVRQDFAGGRNRDSSEQAAERQNDEVLGAIEEEAEKELNAVNRALVKITSGEYGICDRCGEEIASRRLQALPYTCLCLKCASE